MCIGRGGAGGACARAHDPTTTTTTTGSPARRRRSQGHYNDNASTTSWKQRLGNGAVVGMPGVARGANACMGWGKGGGDGRT
jgi:hypothetical protein